MDREKYLHETAWILQSVLLMDKAFNAEKHNLLHAEFWIERDFWQSVNIEKSGYFNCFKTTDWINLEKSAITAQYLTQFRQL